ncbi:MAG: GerMN domain-containing protein [Actinomycetales bacterium]
MSPDNRPMSEQQEERLGELLRERLHREAEHVPVSDDALTRILARTRGGAGDGPDSSSGGRVVVGPWRQARTWVAAAAAAVIVAGGAAVGLGVLGRSDTSHAIAPAQSGSATPVRSSTSSGSLPVATLTGVPVYWLGQQGSDLALFREFQRLPIPSSARATASEAEQRLQAAVTAAVAGQPVDPDYEQVWAPGSAATTQLASDLITVDLNSAAASTSLGSQAATLAVQQLVWTATAAVGQNLPVRITVNGAARDLFGVVSTAQPFTRQIGSADPRAAVWIDDPAQGATVDPTFTAHGSGLNAFENTLSWKVIQGQSVITSGQVGVVGSDGKPVDIGQRGTWSLDLTLPSGQYRLEVSVPDASGGASTAVRMDSKDFTVR